MVVIDGVVVGSPVEQRTDRLQPGQLSLIGQKLNAVAYPPSREYDSNFVVIEPFSFVDATSGVITAQLKAASQCRSLLFVVKKIDAGANAVNVTAAGGETIDGAGTFALAAQWDSVRIYSDGSQWLVV